MNSKYEKKIFERLSDELKYLKSIDSDKEQGDLWAESEAFEGFESRQLTGPGLERAAGRYGGRCP